MKFFLTSACPVIPLGTMAIFGILLAISAVACQNPESVDIDSQFTTKHEFWDQPTLPIVGKPAVDPSKAAYSINQCVSPGLFAITLDDGPSLNALKALDALKSKGAVATFFVNAKNQADLVNEPAAQARLRRIFADGHQVGSHTYSHKNLAGLSQDAMWTELQLNDDVIYSIIGVRPTHVRLPYLSSNGAVNEALGSWGYRIIGVNMDLLDYTHNGVPNEIAENLANFNTGLSLRFPSYISLNHDFTTQIGPWLERMIDLIRSNGFRIVTVAECVGDSYPYRSTSASPVPQFPSVPPAPTKTDSADQELSTQTSSSGRVSTVFDVTVLYLLLVYV